MVRVKLAAVILEVKPAVIRVVHVIIFSLLPKNMRIIQSLDDSALIATFQNFDAYLIGSTIPYLLQKMVCIFFRKLREVQFTYQFTGCFNTVLKFNFVERVCIERSNVRYLGRGC